MRHFAPLVILLLGCGSSLPAPETRPPPQHAFVEVASPPPPARAETVPSQPSDDDVWVDGEWLWKGSRWAWKKGYWTIPKPGSAFSPSTLKRLPDGVLLLAHGSWWSAAGREIEPVYSGASSKTREGAVVTPEGETEEAAPNLKAPPR